MSEKINKYRIKDKIEQTNKIKNENTMFKAVT